MMTDTTPPEMDETTVETYLDGELVESRIVATPRGPATPDVLAARIADLEARLAAADLASVPARFAKLEERLNRAAENAAMIDPAVVTDTGTRGELAKVKGAMGQMAMPPEETI